MLNLEKTAFHEKKITRYFEYLEFMVIRYMRIKRINNNKLLKFK